MGNPNKLWGQTTITADGAQLPTEGKSSIEVGGPVRTAVEADNKAGFFTTATKPSKVECTVLIGAGTSLVALQAIENATIVFECDTGQTYIISNAYVADAVSGSEGKAKVTLQGPPAEEELS